MSWKAPRAFLAVLVAIPSIAAAEPRFGDSTWVAPSVSITGNPETPGPRVARPDKERVWESALRAPFRVAFFPLRLVAHGIEDLGPLAEKIFPPGDLFRVSRPKRGLSVEPTFLGAAVSANQFAGPGSKAKLSGTYSLNDGRKLKLQSYVGDRGVSAVGFGLDGLYDRKPTRAFYGLGNFSPSDRTNYLRRASLASVYAFAGRDHLRRVRVTAGISDMNARPSYGGAAPRAVDRFTPAEVPYLTGQSTMRWFGASAELAALDDSLQPSLGFHLKPDVRRYTSTDGSDLAYDQWRIEARGYLPVFAKRRVLAAKVAYEGLDPRNGSGPVPFYRLPESVDSDRFPGYDPSGRFRDRRLALGQVEYRWEIERPVWAFLLGSLGEVAPNAGALTLRSAHPALGGGLRAKLGTQTGRVEVARGHEGIAIQADLTADF